MIYDMIYASGIGGPCPPTSRFQNSEKRGKNKQSFLREVKRSTRPTAEPSAQKVRIYFIHVPIQGLRLVELNKRGARFFPPWTATKTRGKAESLISMRKAGWVWYRSNRISYQSSLTIVQEDRNDRSGLKLAKFGRRMPKNRLKSSQSHLRSLK